MALSNADRQKVLSPLILLVSGATGRRRLEEDFVIEAIRPGLFPRRSRDGRSRTGLLRRKTSVEQDLDLGVAERAVVKPNLVDNALGGKAALGPSG